MFCAGAQQVVAGGIGTYRAEVRRSFITTTVREESQVTPQVGFELETNGFQFYAIANLDKTSLQCIVVEIDSGNL